MAHHEKVDDKLWLDKKPDDRPLSKLVDSLFEFHGENIRAENYQQ